MDSGRQITVSIITPSFNQGQFLSETIESVLSQEGNFCLDYVVADGGSTDDSVGIIRHYERLLNEGGWKVRCRNIRYRWFSERDRGQTDAIMKGFRLAGGEVLAWLNSDDTYLPGAIQTAADFFLDNPSVSLLYGGSYYSDTHGAIVGRYPTEDVTPRKLAYFNFICQPSAFFRREAFEAVGGLDMDLHYVMDYDFWIRMSKQYEFKYLPEFLSTYRLHEESKTFSSRHAIANHKEALDTVIKYFNWAPLNRVYGYCNEVLKARLPEGLGRSDCLSAILTLPFAIVKYLRLNRGIRLDDIKMINRTNLNKLSLKWIDRQ